MLVSAFILGLFGSLHCVGMCGPIAFMLPLNRENKAKKALQLGLYHVGRLTTYGLLGLLVGMAGKGFSLFGLQQYVSIILGVLMILAILLPKGMTHTGAFSKPIFRAVSSVKNQLGQQLKKQSPDTYFSIGFLNGLLPCGLLYMAVFAAMAYGGLWQGSMYMLLFGLGTIPLMTLVAWSKESLSNRFRGYIQKAIPVVVVLMGVLFIIRGLGLGIPYVSPEAVQLTEKVSTQFDCYP